jgi:hypothetical protein
MRKENKVAALTTHSIPVEASDIWYLMIMTKTVQNTTQNAYNLEN